jgi:hypothetical protein
VTTHFHRFDTGAQTLQVNRVAPAALELSFRAQVEIIDDQRILIIHL